MNREEREQLAERWLNQALQQYSAEEPRPGIEGRILASLAQAPPRRAWAFAFPRFALAGVGVALLVVFGFWQHRRPVQQVAQAPSRAIAPATAQPITSATAQISAIRISTAAHRHAAPRQQPEAQQVSKREQFPSPEPLSKEERLLLTYLRTTPREEVLMAAAQLQAEREEGLKRFNNDSSNSNGQLQ